jgi:ribose transport system ATP-binding protein
MGDAPQGSVTPLLAARGILKRFPGVVALDHVDFDLLPGEIHVLLGQNGAGKSTLIKILAGVYKADAGTIAIGGRQFSNFRAPSDAQAAGIATIHQELALAPHLTVSENLALGQEPELIPGILNRASAARAAVEQMRAFDVDIDPRVRVETLTLAQRQLVAIAKALAQRSRVLILDEPTAVLSESEVEKLFDVLRRLQAQDVGIVYVSHRLEELQRIGDRVTVFRDGKLVETRPLKGESVETLISLIVGRDVGEVFPEPTAATDTVRLRVENLSAPQAFDDVSFTVNAGEIVAITGIVGSGKEHLAQALFGDLDGVSGRVTLDGDTLDLVSPVAAIKAGIGYVPADRKGEGLVLDRNIPENITLASLARYSRFGALWRRFLYNAARKWQRTLDIRGPALGAPVRLYSGGNQQKVVLAKWLDAESRILILVEPTTGLDVGAKVDVYNLARAQAAGGTAILLFSSDLTEVAGLSHRALVMRDGRLVGEFGRGDANEEQLLYHSVVGARRDEEPDRSDESPES